MAATVIPMYGRFGGFGQAAPTGGRGIVPGVLYPPTFPDTSAALVEARIRSIPSADRAAFDSFYRGHPTARGARGFLDAWASAAWGSLQEAERIYTRLYYTASPMLPYLPIGSAGSVFGLTPFFVEWRGMLDDLRHRWDVRHPSKEVLRVHLDALLPDAEIPVDTRIEVTRAAESYRALAREIQESLVQEAASVSALIGQRTEDETFGQVARDVAGSLTAGVGAVGAIITGTARFVVSNVVAPLVKTLVPWWLWPVLGFVGYQVVVGSPVYATARAVLRK